MNLSKITKDYMNHRICPCDIWYDIFQNDSKFLVPLKIMYSSLLPTKSKNDDVHVAFFFAVDCGSTKEKAIFITKNMMF